MPIEEELPMVKNKKGGCCGGKNCCGKGHCKNGGKCCKEQVKPFQLGIRLGSGVILTRSEIEEERGL